jgi:serine/threonine-protein kinase SRPK3
LTGHWLFEPEGCEEWSREDDHLAKMMEFTGEKFSTSLLERSLFRNVYFDNAGESILFKFWAINIKYYEGNLLRIGDLIPASVEDALTNYGLKDIGLISQFIRDCLRLDPDERPSTKEVQSHAWLSHAFACCC